MVARPSRSPALLAAALLLLPRVAQRSRTRSRTAALANRALAGLIFNDVRARRRALADLLALAAAAASLPWSVAATLLAPRLLRRFQVAGEALGQSVLAQPGAYSSCWLEHALWLCFLCPRLVR